MLLFLLYVKVEITILVAPLWEGGLHYFFSAWPTCNSWKGNNHSSESRLLCSRRHASHHRNRTPHSIQLPFPRPTINKVKLESVVSTNRGQTNHTTSNAPDYPEIHFAFLCFLALNPNQCNINYGDI